MTLNGVMALFCFISANSVSFRAHCVEVRSISHLLMSLLLLMKTSVFRSTPPNRPNNIRGGPTYPSVDTSVYVSTSVHKKFSDFNEIWCVDGGARPYAIWPDPRLRSRSRGFWISKNCTFKVYLLRHLQCELANDHRFLNYRTISKFGRAGFVILILVFVLRDFELGGKLCALQKI